MLNSIRRSFFPAAFPTLAAFANAQRFGILAFITLVFAIIATLAYSYFDRVAREKGLIDSQNNF